MPTPLDAIRWPLTTERLLIRRTSVADVPAVAAIRARPGVSEWLTVTGDADRIAAYLADPARLRSSLVVEHADGIVGDAMMKVNDAWAQAEVEDQGRASQAELGWVIDPAHSRIGLATELVTALVQAAFDQLDVRRVTAECFAGNEPSWRLMERVGMRREAHTVADSLHRSGTWLDGYSYALLASEWRAPDDGERALR